MSLIMTGVRVSVSGALLAACLLAGSCLATKCREARDHGSMNRHGREILVRTALSQTDSAGLPGGLALIQRCDSPEH
jgi:hypothetical protein